MCKNGCKAFLMPLISCHHPLGACDWGRQGRSEWYSGLTPTSFPHPSSHQPLHVHISKTAAIQAGASRHSYVTLPTAIIPCSLLVMYEVNSSQEWDPRVQKDSGHHSLTSTSSPYSLPQVWQNNNGRARGRMNGAKKAADSLHCPPQWYLWKIKFLIAMLSPIFLPLEWPEKNVLEQLEHKCWPGELELGVQSRVLEIIGEEGLEEEQFRITVQLEDMGKDRTWLFRSRNFLQALSIGFVGTINSETDSSLFPLPFLPGHKLPLQRISSFTSPSFLLSEV